MLPLQVTCDTGKTECTSRTLIKELLKVSLRHHIAICYYFMYIKLQYIYTL